MKKFIVIVILSITFILCNTLFYPALLQEQDKAPIRPVSAGQAAYTPVIDEARSSAGAYPAAKVPEETLYENIHHFSFNSKTVNFYKKNNNIYITYEAPKNLDTGILHEIKPNTADSSKLLVNKDNSLPKDYAPQKLTAIRPDKVKLEYPDLQLIPRTLDALYSMVEAAKDAGIKGFIVNSAYRSLSTQQIIFDSNLNSFKKTSKTYEEAYAKTRLLVALPGNSEHHTGLALDIFSVTGRHRDDFEGTGEQIWLNRNLYKYGFILRYPRDKTEKTSSTYEPWHIRFTGIPLSTYMTEKKLCLEEFYEKILSDGILENSPYLFMRVKSSQKVYVAPELLNHVELESVNKENALLTVKND